MCIRSWGGRASRSRRPAFSRASAFCWRRAIRRAMGSNGWATRSSLHPGGTEGHTVHHTSRDGRGQEREDEHRDEGDALTRPKRACLSVAGRETLQRRESQWCPQWSRKRGESEEPRRRRADGHEALIYAEHFTRSHPSPARCPAGTLPIQAGRVDGSEHGDLGRGGSRHLPAPHPPVEQGLLYYEQLLPPTAATPHAT